MRCSLAIALLASAACAFKPPTPQQVGASVRIYAPAGKTTVGRCARTQTHPLPPSQTKEVKDFLGNAAKQFKSALPTVDAGTVKKDAERKATAARLRAAAADRMRAPAQLDEDQVAKMEALGYAYDAEKRTWTHGAKRRGPSPDEPRFGRSDDVDAYTEELWFTAAAAEFDDEQVLVEPFRRKAKFARKPPPAVEDRAASESLASQEPLRRLGFAYDADTGRWSRGAARRTARTVEILSRKRTLKVSAVEDWDMAAVNRLDFLLTQTLMEAPENVWGGALRWAREPAFPLIWLALQTKVWDAWAASTPVLGDAFAAATSPMIPATDEARLALGASAGVFLVAAWLQKAAWAGSSGSLAVGAAERAIADDAFGAVAPASAATRAELGLPYRLCAAALVAASALPRAAFLHQYAQQKLEYDLFAMAGLDGVIGDFGASAAAAGVAGSILAVGALSGLGEAATWNWVRAPATDRDELNAIANELETDQLRVRKLEERAESLDPARDGPAVVKVAFQSAERAVRDADAFERVADSWLLHFHDTSSVEVEVDDASRERKADGAVGSAVLSGAAAAAAYAATGYDLRAVAGLHGAGALVDALAPTAAELKTTKVAALDVPAADAKN